MYEVPKRKKTMAVGEVESQLQCLQALRDEGEWPGVGYGKSLVFDSNHRGKSLSALACVKLLAVGIMLKWTNMEGTSAEFADGSHVGIGGEEESKVGGWGAFHGMEQLWGGGVVFFFQFLFFFPSFFKDVTDIQHHIRM